MPDRTLHRPLDPWTVAIHQHQDDHAPMGTGVVITPTRVLTCAHVVGYDGRWHDELWVSFPKAPVSWDDRRRVARCLPAEPEPGIDLAVLELAEPVPPPVTPARIRSLPAEQLCDLDWWTFGFPEEAGEEARGTVGAKLAWGKVALATCAPHRLASGFSGGGVWSSHYDAVIGLVVAAAAGGRHDGNGHALTIHQADRELPELGLAELAQWTAGAAGDQALAAWGWVLRDDPEAGRHWLPRGRGVAVAGERGHRFRGRAESLTELVRWLDRPTPDGQVLVVTGSPGAGKSAVLGRLVTTADRELRAQLPLDDGAPRATEGSVGCAVHAKGKAALDVAREIARAASVALPEAAEELVPALRERLASRPRRFNVIVDALDEAASPEQARRLVCTVLLPLATTGAGLGIQVVVGTRRADDEGDLLGAFAGNASIIDLDHPDYFVEPDLTAYAEATLRLLGDERPDNPYADPAVAGPVAGRIAALAGRNFLVAGLVAAAHGRQDTDPVEPDKVSFTPTVDAALDAYLAGLAPVGPTSARLALTVLAYAEPPGLPLPLWRAGVAALGGTATEEQLATFAHTAAANFLVETNTGPAVRAYRLFHQALTDALLRGQEALGARAADERRLFDTWLDHGHRTGGWSAAYDYLLHNLPAHARRAGRVDELLAEDRYLLHADLRRVLLVADGATTDLGKARVRVLQRTPLAVGASAPERAAMFSVTERLDRLASRFPAAAGAPYRARWARTVPRHELAALEGHTGSVLAVCPLPIEGHGWLASAGEDGTVRLWDPATGQPGPVLTGHTDWVRAICAIPTGDGRHLLASASDDHTVRLWNPATRQAGAVLTGHTDWVRGICAIPTDSGAHLLASASDDYTVRLWNPATGRPERVLDGHPGWVTAVCPVTVDGRRLLATAGFDTVVRLWDPGTGQLARALDGRTGWVTALCTVYVDGRELLATAGYDATVCLWDPATGRRERLLTGLTRPVTGLGAVPTGTRTLLAAASEDSTVRLWDPATGECAQVLTGHTDWVRGACGLPVGGRHLLASAGDDGTVRLWDPATGQPERVIDGAGPVAGLCGVAAGGSTVLASTGRDGAVRLWDPATGDRRRSLDGHTAAVTGVCEVPVAGRRLLASASDDSTIRLWEPETGRPVRVLAGDHPAVTAICAVPGTGGDRLASASDTLRLWDPATARIDRVLGHLRWVTAVCTVPVAEGRHLLASADEDGVVRLWDPVAGALERELRCHHAATTAVCAVPLGGRHLLASASADHTVLLWDPESGARVWALHGHTAPVTGLCVVGASGRELLASTSSDRTVRLWDPATGTVRLSIPVYHRALACWQEAGTLVIGLESGILALQLGGG
jgi:WD40 repeat protein